MLNFCYVPGIVIRLGSIRCIKHMVVIKIDNETGNFNIII